MQVAAELCEAIKRACELLLVCGSLRRRKLKVSDVEIVYVPTFLTVRDGLFDQMQENQTDLILIHLIAQGVIAQRKNKLGSVVWGEKNKLAIHVASGIPVDFFATRQECWWNYVCCRTGGARNNTLIAEAYQRKGCQWNPYDIGYTDRHGRKLPNIDEPAVFLNAGLKYLKPWERP
jgi:DNA polymerase/3'-5' exonuclease PolX